MCQILYNNVLIRQNRSVRQTQIVNRRSVVVSTFEKTANKQTKKNTSGRSSLFKFQYLEIRGENRYIKDLYL